MRRSGHRHGQDPRRRGLDPDRHARHLLRPPAGGRRSRAHRRRDRRRAAGQRPLAARRRDAARPRAHALPHGPRGRARLLPGAAGSRRLPAAAVGPGRDGVRRVDRRGAPARVHAAVLGRRLRADRPRHPRAGRRAGGRPVHAAHTPAARSQHADAGAALRRPPHLLHRHALRRRQRAVRGRLARADARGVGARRLAGVDADPLLRPRRGTGRGRGGRRAPRAHPPPPAGRPSWARTCGPSSSSSRPSRARRPAPTAG